VTIYVSARNVDEINRQGRVALESALADLAGRGKTLETFAVTGSRGWFDWRLMWRVLSLVPPDATMFNGMADGADCLARSFWWTQGGEVRPFWAKWRQGKGAGLTRNTIMMEHMPQLVLEFLRHDLPSPGTRHAQVQAEQRGLRVFAFHQFVGDPDRSEATNPIDPDKRSRTSRVSR
jgi:YspA, cpYpsA-related SLOG family